MADVELQKQLTELQNELEGLKKRVAEDEAVIASLQAWTQYGFGMLLKHLACPNDVDRAHVSDLLEKVFGDMYRTLKQGFRGDAEMTTSTDGFDRLYICAQETADIWQLMRDYNFEDSPDQDGYKLINVALDMMYRIDPLTQRHSPFETPEEKRLRKFARDAVFQAKNRRA